MFVGFFVPKFFGAPPRAHAAPMPRPKFATPEEKAHWRRAQVARASRTLRERRRQESTNLREENALLKAERKAMEDSIARLQAEIALGGNVDDDQIALAQTEHNLVDLQLDQQTLLLFSLLDEAEAHVPGGDVDKLNRDIAEETLDSAFRASLRGMSVLDVKEGRMEPCVVDMPDKDCCAVVSTCLHDGFVKVRIDAVIREVASRRQFSAQSIREVIVQPYVALSLFIFAFACVAGPADGCWTRELTVQTNKQKIARKAGAIPFFSSRHT